MMKDIKREAGDRFAVPEPLAGTAPQYPLALIIHQR